MRIDGKEIAENIFNDLKKKKISAHLAIILIGDDPASIAYVKQKILKANKIGIKTTLINLESRIKPSPRAQAEGNHELKKTNEGLNNDDNVHGIIIQRPLPPHIDSALIDRAIDPKKDVDAFHPKSKFDSPISMAVLAILEHIYYSRIQPPTPGVEPQKFIAWLNAKKIVVVGKGETGGGPVIKTLKKLKMIPTVIDSKTPNPQSITKKADIVISAVGKPNVLNASVIKKGAILISIGLHKGTDGKLHGDYEESEIKNIASFYTPTPGGVGPVNVAMLLKNVVVAADSI